MRHHLYQPVFVIGAARSGTKLLRDILALHPAMDSVPYDINFIWRLGNESISHDELALENVSPHISRRIQGKLEKFHQGNGFLIEKTVSNCLRIPFVDAIFPGAKYIFLIRDGWDVVESAYRQWNSPPDWNYLLEKARSYPFLDAPGYALKYALNLFKNKNSPEHKTWGPRYQGIDDDVAKKDLFEVCAIQWSRSVEKAHKSLGKIESSRKIVIRYEDFVKQPLQSLTTIAGFLGLGFEPYTNKSLLSRVRLGNVGKGLRQLTESQQKLFKPVVMQTMTKLGYSAS